MSLRNEIPELIDFIQSKKEYLDFNRKMFRMFEGELYPFVLAHLKHELSLQSFVQAEPRAASFNILKKINDKLATIYQENPWRTSGGDRPGDQDRIRYYENNMAFDASMNVANEFYNWFGCTLVRPFVHKGKPRLKPIPNDRFLVYSNDPVDDTYVTHVLIHHGKRRMHDGNLKSIWHIYTDNEFAIINEDGQLQPNLMAQFENDGTNPFGVIPFQYINSSTNLLMPIEDWDGYKINILLSVLFSDLNFAQKFQTFSILYTNAQIDNPIFSPNIILRLQKSKSALGEDEKPFLEQIKPQVDVEKSLSLINAQVSVFLDTRGIKPGGIGSASIDNLQSGVAMIVNEADTTDLKKKQIEVFKASEYDLWKKIIHKLHPIWIAQGLIDNIGLFQPSLEVFTHFKTPIPMVSTKAHVEEILMKYDGGLISRREAIKELRPRISEEEIDAVINEIDADRLQTFGANNGQTAVSEDQTSSED
jgi:hypothetical protein